ncbi:uncharacterized protein CLAFUR5_04810 [Fulvia fulva]|uniref:Zn(2)-C6 fungal-type domain-containing protein n=1 Tax=Passalora fulva TaxID=5499 RepID=A0A9Q8LF92_PASFU|nr:uncharacterized protein CLAFUR5_04810 [Fulvia fulva]UJO16134.1 hypothetical protein CLAFUR5_04810 [Fulvia fulva]
MMNQHQQTYPPFPPQQQQGPYAYPNTYPPPLPQTTPYSYPPALTQQPQPLQHSPPQIQQNSTPAQNQPQQQSQFFQTLPQGAPRAQPSRNRQQRVNNGNHNDPSSVPSTPGNGPGAPPPMPNSPPNYEEELMSALQQDHPNNSHVVIDDTLNDDNDNDDEDDDDVHMGDGNDDEPIYQLPPPPEAIYPNEVDLEKAMHAWSLEHGYELVRRASKKNARGLLYKRYFHCSKHGKTSTQKKDADKNKVRINRKSNRIGCPMSLAAVAVDPHDPSGNWQIRHRKTHHNHPAVDAIKLAGHRRRARIGGVEKAVDGLFAIGTNTSDVLKFLQRTNPDGLFNRTDVANMKLKYKKYGTCAQRPDDGTVEKQVQVSSKSGFPSACTNCRSKKTKCDSIRPVCGACAKNGTQCHYDHAPHPRVEQPAQTINAPPPAAVQLQSSQHMPEQQMNGMDNSMAMIDQQPLHPQFSNTPSINHQNAQQAEQVLAALANFQQEHVKPTRLTLESSAVEVLANSVCGNGDSYRTVMPRPFTLGSDWRLFKDNFIAAAVKENSYDVLIGDKKEPVKPTGDLTVEENNEYIKQLAIFKRRNEMLKIGLKECLAANMWSRMNQYKTANEIWLGLEDMCMPRGSDQAYVRFLEINNITLPNSGSLDQFVHNLEMKYNDFNQLQHHHDTRRLPPAERAKKLRDGNGTFPEDMLCFIFLRNLGHQHQTLASNLCKKNNIGGYGSGERLGFKELTSLVKRAMDWEASRQASGGR